MSRAEGANAETTSVHTSAQDVHERIRLEAEALRRCEGFNYNEIDERPALRALLQAATDRIEGAISSSFEHEGRVYFMCVRLAWVELGIHTTPDEAAPLVHVFTEGGGWCGHQPGQ